jgi:hypothetical protein
MSAYLQMGHDSENLVGVPGLDGFAGLILSPVNRSESELGNWVRVFRTRGQFDVAFDPQLYCPQSDRGHLADHSYFPKDLDTADPSSESWWRELVTQLATEAVRLKVDAVCSPVVLPRKYGPDYYAQCSETYSMLAADLKGTAIRPILTVCVGLKEMAEPSDALRIASIVTGHNPQAGYVVIEADVEPRREIADAANLLSVMVLVSALETSGCRTLVSHSSSDMLLMKAAGASHCASGKFFNLRRFSRSRFDEQQEGGGGQLPYWFEHSLLGFLREADIARLRRAGLEDFIGGGDSNNSFADQILKKFINEPAKPWVALSWRQYLAWFTATEKRLSGPDALTLVDTWLRQAEERWLTMEDKDILLEESRNNGKWIRPWRQALGDFRRLETQA